METTDEEELEDLTPDEIEFLYGKPPSDTDVPEPDGTTDRPSAAPLDYGHAAWFAARAQEADLRVEMYEAEYNRLIRKLQADLRETVEPLLKRVAWFDRGVEMWHRSALVAGEPVGKTVRFPCGRESKLRKARPIVQVTDHELHMAFVEEQGWGDVYKQFPLDDRYRVSKLMERVTVVEGPEPGAFGELVTGDGEKVPGISVIMQQDGWSNGQPKGRKR